MTPEDTAKSALAARLGCPAQQLTAEDKTHLYPWLEHHRFVWLTDATRRIRLCAVTEGDEALFFADDDPKCLGPLGELFAREELALPRGISADELCDALRDLLRGPGGMIGSDQNAAREAARIRSWVKGEAGGADERLFQRHCRDPEVSEDEGGWSLVFSYFTRSGGVERWRISGAEQRFTGVEVEQAAPEGRLRFPYV